MDATIAPPATPPPKRHLGHFLKDTILAPIQRTSPRQFLQNFSTLFTSLAYIHRALLILTPLLLAIAEYELPGFLPTVYELPICITAYALAGLVVFAGVTVADWLGNAAWPWQESGWVWPWERWFWGANLNESEFGGSTMSMQGVGDMGAVREKSMNGHETPLMQNNIGVNAQGSAKTPETEKVQNQTTANTPGSANTNTHDDTTPPTGFRPAGHRSSLTPPTTSTPPPLPNWTATDFLIPPTPQLPRSMRSNFLAPPTPANMHHSGLLGESPRPSRFSGNPFARRADGRAAASEWLRPGATKAEKERARKRMDDVFEMDREGEVLEGGFEEALRMGG